MLNRSCSIIAKPSFLLVHPEFPSCSALGPSFQVRRKYEKRLCFFARLKCYMKEKNYRYADSTASKPQNARFDRRQGESSSLYSRPSLLEMKNERLENRARVYEFLRAIGIVPDELEGLELPVTVEVMKERVDFLQKLGLTIEDINNYPLVLGCSVKKNMIPVLDYLGKLGVRESTFVEFLRRYPQVLHASVVVDLEPVVKYLQGMDIKPNDIPRVLEKYPEVLGFKLEGTMSTSVAYLVGIGVERREIGGVLTRYPEILGMRVGRIIKPFVDYLESLGLRRSVVARLIEQRPHILGFGLEDRVIPNVESLLEFNVKSTSLRSVLAQYPEIMGIDLKPRLQNQYDLLHSIIGLSSEEFGRVVERMPQVVSLSYNPIKKHVEFLEDCGFSLRQIKEMVVWCPQLLALNIDIMKMSFDYFQMEMKRPLEDLVFFPAFFTYGLESTVKPRHKMIAQRGLNCSLGWMLNCSDEKFKDRMDYDGIDMEEMDQQEKDTEEIEQMPSYDTNTLVEIQSGDDSASDKNMNTSMKILSDDDSASDSDMNRLIELLSDNDMDTLMEILSDDDSDSDYDEDSDDEFV